MLASTGTRPGESSSKQISALGVVEIKFPRPWLVFRSLPSGALCILLTAGITLLIGGFSDLGHDTCHSPNPPPSLAIHIVSTQDNISCTGYPLNQSINQSIVHAI